MNCIYGENMKNKNSVMMESVIEWFAYGASATGSLFSQFFVFCGFSSIEIGFLAATGPVISFFSNPFWLGMVGKKGFKMTLPMAVICAAMGVWLVFLLPGFWGKMLGLSVSTFFTTAITPMIETRIIKSVKIKNKRYDLIRIWGTIGYGSLALCAGILVKIGFHMIFITQSIMFLTIFIISFKMKDMEEKDLVAVRSFSKDRGNPPEVKDLSSVPILNLPKETGSFKMFMVMMVFSALSLASASFNSVYLPLFISERGYDISSAGISFSLMAFCEIPFLLFAEKIVKKIGNFLLLTSAMFVLGLKIFLVPHTDSLMTLLLVLLLNSWNFIVIYYSIYNYIHFKLPQKHVMKAQTIFWMAQQGLAFLAGSIGGGFLINHFGVEKTFSGVGIFLFSLSIVITVVYFFLREKAGKKEIR